MGETGRFAVFLSVVLGIWTAMHGYVLARLWHLPGLTSVMAHRLLFAAAAVLWLSYPLGRALARGTWSHLGYPFELLGAVWMGTLFLLLVSLLAADLLTGFGWLLPHLAAPMRLGAVAAAGALSLVGLAQGLRPPVVRHVEVVVPGLPSALDGTVAVQISDLHLGTLLKGRWLERVIGEVEAERPAIIFVTGDLIDGDVAAVEPLVPMLKRLEAPLGAWAVTGNHEYYAGIEKSVSLMEAAGFTVLRDRAGEAAPGLVVAGVDDLSARRQFHLDGDPVTAALTDRPAGAAVFLSHSPLEAEKAAALGARLMLSGHTHDGQIWPFGYLVRVWYPFLCGRFRVGAMTLLVSRGTGSWGPPMRLFAPGEILAIRLRCPPRSAS